MQRTLRLGDPLPKPNYERTELDTDTNMRFWCLVLYEFDSFVSGVQSRILYHNKSSSSRKGLHQ